MNNLKVRCEHGWRDKIDCPRCRDLDSANDVAENIRLTVLRLLHTSNPDESIVGACNNSEMIKQLLRDENALLKVQVQHWKDRLDTVKGLRDEGYRKKDELIARLTAELESIKGEKR